jgi:TonB family protein
MRFTIGLRWRAVKGGVEKNPVFLLKAGFFIFQAMKKLISNVMENWNLRVSASISLGLHLLLIFTASILFSDTKVRQTAIRHVKVTLHTLEEEKKSTPKFVSPLSVKNPIQRPEKRQSIQEQKEREPDPKKEKEFEPPIPLPVQAVARDIPVEEPKVIFPPREEEKIVKEPANVAADVALEKTFNLKKEEGLSISSLPGVLQGNNISDTASGEGVGIRQGGSPEGGSGNGSGAGRGGFHWRVSWEGTGLGQGGSSGGGSGSGLGPRTGSGQGDSRGGAAGGYPRYGENPKPPYPEEARRKGMEGEVVLRVEVLANGWVGQIEVKRSSGHEILDRSALSIVKQWKFIPANKENGSIPCWVNIPIKFQLQ